MKLTVYTDWWCRPNPWWPWAWAFYIVELDMWWSIFLEETTNNIAELMALNIALKEIKDIDFDELEFVMDSEYAMNTSNWKRKAIKNKEIVWENRLLIYNIQLRIDKRITRTRVKWHNWDKYNELVDKMCNDLVFEKTWTIPKY